MASTRGPRRTLRAGRTRNADFRYNPGIMEARDLFVAAELRPEEVVRFLEALGFRDPRRADRHLQRIAHLTEAPERLAGLADALLSQVARSADPDAALRHLESFLERVAGPLNLLSLLESVPETLEILVGILGGSPYLTQGLVRNPEYFYWLLERSRLQRVRDFDYFRSQAAEATRPFSEAAAALDALRRLRRREALRIGAQDILGLTTLEDTVTQVSDLADALLQESFEVLARGRLEPPFGFAVIALGKLGGRELNFSSDVDLLFLYADGADPDRMVRFARDYNRALGDFTSEGRLYRVDLRLRPMGRTGEIVYSEKAYRQYYLTWADTTDRLALIKCRPVAGDPDLGRRFLDSVQDFVFKKYLDFAAVEEIRWIKKRTDETLRRRRESATHIKLGLGGIREIEFFAQSFQILYGGGHPELRTPNTREALRRLVDLGFIGQNDFESLSQAYVFLRDLEHKLQLVHDLQTHSLPEDDEEFLRCARRMGYAAESEEDRTAPVARFRQDLARHTERVRRVFESLLQESGEDRDLGELALNPALDPERALDRLRSRGVERAEAVLEGIQMLVRAPASPQSPSRMRNLLANLIPILVERSRWSPHPRELFSRLDRFCESLGSRGSLYVEMIENPDFAARLLTLLSAGESLAETLIRSPELLDSVVRPPEEGDYGDALERFVTAASDARTSGRRDALRSFKRREEFKIAVGEIDDPGASATRPRLTRLAEACLAFAWRAALDAHPFLGGEPCALVALGKLGGREMAFRSDLDLVFVYDDDQSARPAADFFDLLRDFKAELQEYTTGGRAYEVDFRLRPEGRHAAEAVSLSQLRGYFDSRLEAWERLAYVKARAVISQGWAPDLSALVFARRFDDRDRARLLHVRGRKEREIGQESKTGAWDLKVGRGALLDIQFIVQYLQVQHRIQSSNLLNSIDKLTNSGILAEADGHRLREASEFLYTLELARDLEGNPEPNRLPRLASKNWLLARRLGLDSGETLVTRYLDHTEEVRRIFERILGAPA
jgi:[glutamine synthetase] adenylyltransferase / [glutamine synthetase]-adenylyl-L-tyrosine phosphorylase